MTSGVGDVSFREFLERCIHDSDLRERFASDPAGVIAAAGFVLHTNDVDRQTQVFVALVRCHGRLPWGRPLNGLREVPADPHDERP